MQASEYENIFRNEEIHGWYRGMKFLSLQFLEKYLPKKKNLTILDAGCGTGAMVSALNKYGQVYGIDNSSLAVSFCRKRNLKNISKASVEKIPFKDRRFDLVTSFDVLYINGLNYEQALKEFSRILKKNGILLIRVPAFEFLRGGHDTVVHTGHRFVRKELASFIKEARFSIKFISYSNFFLFLPILLTRILSRKKEPKSDVGSMAPISNFLLGKLLILEGKIMEFTPLPFGVSLFVVAQKI